MSLIRWIPFEVKGDARGKLVAIEEQKDIPFPIRRVYYIYATQPGVARGFHVHKKLEQVAVCVSGRCRMVLDDGRRRESVWLDRPDRGLYIGPMIWHEMHDFSEDCVLLVLASDVYDEEDYIRDHGEFMKAVHGL